MQNRSSERNLAGKGGGVVSSPEPVGPTTALTPHWKPNLLGQLGSKSLKWGARLPPTKTSSHLCPSLKASFRSVCCLVSIQEAKLNNWPPSAGQKGRCVGSGLSDFRMRGSRGARLLGRGEYLLPGAHNGARVRQVHKG